MECCWKLTVRLQKVSTCSKDWHNIQYNYISKMLKKIETMHIQRCLFGSIFNSNPKLQTLYCPCLGEWLPKIEKRILYTLVKVNELDVLISTHINFAHIVLHGKIKFKKIYTVWYHLCKIENMKEYHILFMDTIIIIYMKNMKLL